MLRPYRKACTPLGMAIASRVAGIGRQCTWLGKRSCRVRPGWAMGVRGDLQVLERALVRASAMGPESKGPVWE